MAEAIHAVQQDEDDSASFPDGLLDGSACFNKDQQFIIQLAYAIKALRDKLDKQYRVNFNILLTSICKYLHIPYRAKQFLTPSQRHTASVRPVSIHLTPTNFRRNPYGGHRGIKAKDLCVVHSILNTFCSPSSEEQRTKCLLLFQSCSTPYFSLYSRPNRRWDSRTDWLPPRDNWIAPSTSITIMRCKSQIRKYT